MSAHPPGVERRDVSPRAVALALFWFFVALLGSIGLILFVSRSIARREVSVPEAGPHFARPGVSAPRLESDPIRERARLEDAARKRIDSLGWSDRNRRLVHIPVEAAMRRLVASGWPPEGGVRGPEATARAHVGAGK